MDQKGQVSPDGQWHWDGQKWISTLSPDGKSRWDGGGWVPSRAPVANGARVGVFGQIPGLRTGAAWKLAVGGFVTLLAIGALSTVGAQPPSTSTSLRLAPVSPAATPSTVSRPASPSLVAAASPSPSPVATAVVEPSPINAPVQDPYAAAKAAGASAVCADGSWSFSKTRSGTCSGHGGVHWWTGNLGPAGPGAH